MYWSASQLLSKLDHPHHNYGPYVHGEPYGYGGSPAGVHHVPAGPHSLQPAHGPSSLHNVSFTESLRYSTASGRQSQQPHHIPEEYTITVGKWSDHDSSSSRRSSSVNNKVPPPVLPKPRNITQV